MKHVRLLLFLMLAFALTGMVAYAAPSSVNTLAVLPDPVVAGSSASISWDSDLDGNAITFRVYIPSDWYSSVDWKAGTGVTPTTLSGLTYAVSACTDTTIGGVSVICAEYSNANLGSETIESVDLSFTMSASAVPGTDSRPVRVTNVAGSAGPPNIQTIFTSVVGVPETRYIADPGACLGLSPCNMGVTALQDSLTALPATGGTIIVIGNHVSDGDVAVGARDLTLQPYNASSALVANGSCTSELLLLDGAGDLTIDGLALDGNTGSCPNGITVTGSGDLTVQNSTNSITDFATDGVRIAATASGSHLFDNSTFSGNGDDGIDVAGGTATITGSVLSANSGAGVDITNGGTSVMAMGNTFTGNTSYGLNKAAAASLVALANNFSGNNSGGFQALINSNAASAKNWWGSHTDPNVGPEDSGNPGNSFASGWDRRLGAAVIDWAAGDGGTTLGNAALSGGSGTGAIIDMGSDSANAPFDNGVPPYVNQACSPFYDFYSVDGSGGWTVQLPIDGNNAGCVANVLNQEIAYVINDVSQCSPANNTACWDLIDAGSITVNNNNLLITGLDLSGTHIVAGESSGGLDPTAVNLTSSHSTAVANPGLAILIIGALLGTGLLAWTLHRGRRVGA